MRRYVTGVYFITNLINGKVYVGSANNCYDRWRTHLCELRQGIHSSKHLQRSFKKYGESNFWFTIVEMHPIGTDRNYLFSREQMFIDALECYKSSKGYNILKTAGHCRGHKYSKKQVEANRRRNLGKRLSEAHRKAISEGNKGRVFSVESKAKTSKALSGHLGAGNKPILQFDLEGNFIAEYRSVAEAARNVQNGKTEKAKTCQIVRSCTNRYPTGIGFKWKFKSLT